MANNNVRVIQGKDVFLYARRLKDAKTEPGKLIPFQTSLTFGMSRDTDKTQTKSGVVSTSAAIETDLEVEFINNTSAIADAFRGSLLSDEVLECWVVDAKRFDEEGRVYNWYMRATVSEDSSDNDPDDNSTRDVTLSVTGTPKDGWSKLPKDALEQLEYVYRGLEAMGESISNGVPWKASDEGKNIAEEDVKKPAGSVTRTGN
ncbi:phage major tail protein, TP901-1 family [Lactobacillus sp. AN1001]